MSQTAESLRAAPGMLVEVHTFGSPRRATGDRVWDFMRVFQLLHCYPPTVREIAAGLGLGSLATVHYHLRQLEAERRLTRSGWSARTARGWQAVQPPAKQTMQPHDNESARAIQRAG